MTYVIATQLKPTDRGAFIASIGSMIRPKLEAAGADYVVVQEGISSGSQTGMFTVGSRWSSVDQGVVGLGAFYADPEVAAFLASTPVDVAFRGTGIVDAERGNPNGAFTVVLSAVMSNYDPSSANAFYDDVHTILAAAGVNGMRMIRWIAAGELSGSWAALFYTDSIDQYMAGFAALYADESIVSRMAGYGFNPLSRSISINH
ncbi:MAG: hypothetical protein ACO3SQ_02335 [Ilumatobacteraceae bacterium]